MFMSVSMKFKLMKVCSQYREKSNKLVFSLIEMKKKALFFLLKMAAMLTSTSGSLIRRLKLKEHTEK